MLQLRLALDSVAALVTDVAGQMQLMATGLGVVIRTAELKPVLSGLGSITVDDSTLGTNGSSAQDVLVAISSARLEAGEDLLVLFDRPHVAQVLANFCSNAVKFSQPGAMVAVRSKTLRQVRLRQVAAAPIIGAELPRRLLATASNMSDARLGQTSADAAEAARYTTFRCIGAVDAARFARLACGGDWAEILAPGSPAAGPVPDATSSPVASLAAAEVAAPAREVVIDIVELSVEDHGCGISPEDGAPLSWVAPATCSSRLLFSFAVQLATSSRPSTRWVGGGKSEVRDAQWVLPHQHPARRTAHR